MLTFIHLSDIHFSSGDDASQFDLNQQIRRALLDDLAKRPADGAAYDAILVTGDIAYSGKKDEYETAKKFLGEVYARTALSMKETYVVPGNHDVDRAHVQPNLALWDSHEKIRREANPVHWRVAIQTQLQKDPSQILLAPLRTYNDFAQGCDCQTTADKLAWSLLFPKPLERGFRVRLYGLNSALLSDAADAPAKLLVSEFQTTSLCDIPGEVNVTMCHHPPDWLMDKAELFQALRRFAPVALFGHEHRVRVLADDKQVQLFAGSVQPDRSEPGWAPTYHVLQLSIDGTTEPHLVVRVHTREFHNYGFRAWRNEDEKEISEHRIRVKPQPISGNGLTPTPPSVIGSTGSIPVADATTLTMRSEDAHRELRVNFFLLRTPQRYEVAFKAGLLRDGDDTLDPQVMWAEVFRRAEEENKLAAFWSEIAAHTPAMSDHPNPFNTGEHAQTYD